jgi:hypothetical protein
MLQGDSYKNDGASALYDDTTDADGLISVVGSATTTAGYLTCGTSGQAIAQWNSITAGYFRITIDNTDYDVGPMDFSSDADMDAVAATIQTALRSSTGNTETVTHSGTGFVITSSTATNQSNVDYVRPYYPAVTGSTSIHGNLYMNGEKSASTKTFAVNQQTLTLTDWDGNDAVLSTTADGEKGTYVLICDTNLENVQYSLLSANTATTATITPSFATQPSAGWYWFIGGINPIWEKWFDFGQSANKHKVHGVAISVDPSEGATGNRMALHGKLNLVDTVTARVVQTLGTAEDTVNTLHLKDRSGTQVGLKINRPSSSHDFKLESITINHRAER